MQRRVHNNKGCSELFFKELEGFSGYVEEISSGLEIDPKETDPTPCPTTWKQNNPMAIQGNPDWAALRLDQMVGLQTNGTTLGSRKQHTNQHSLSPLQTCFRDSSYFLTLPQIVPLCPCLGCKQPASVTVCAAVSRKHSEKIGDGGDQK